MFKKKCHVNGEKHFCRAAEMCTCIERKNHYYMVLYYTSTANYPILVGFVSKSKHIDKYMLYTCMNYNFEEKNRAICYTHCTDSTKSF